MNLWIRSQDREKLYLVKDICIIGKFRYEDGKDKNTINQIVDEYEILGSEHLLGTYETKRRTLEVLDEIQERLKDNCVYEMPKE